VSDTTAFVRITGEDIAPAPFRQGWLPDDSPFPELDALREKFLQLAEQKRVESANAHAIQEKIEGEKQRREVALRDAMLNGTSPDDVEDNREALAAELATAKERTQAARQALVEHINHCIEVVLEKRPEWLAQIAQREADIAAEVAELEAKLRAANARKGSAFRLEHWLERTQAGAEFAPSHIPYSDILPPPSADPADQAALQQRRMEQSYEGGMGGTTKISDAAGREREQEHESTLGVSDAERERVEASLLPTVGGVSS
jgi:hypothetical protein